MNARQRLLATTILAGGGFLGLGAAPAFAVTGVCPGIGFAALGCDLVITLNANGTATITNGPSHGIAGGTYDNSDDTLIGIINNSGHTVNNLRLTSTLTIAAFDGDGIRTNPNPTSGLSNGPLNAAGLTLNTSHGSGAEYEGTVSGTGGYNLSGPLDTFSSISPSKTAVTLNLTGGLLAGGSAFFSLEEPLTAASFTVTPVPEPASLALLGAALAGFGVLRRRRKNNPAA